MTDKQKTIKIDDKDYNLKDLSEVARNQVLNLKATDAEIAAMERKLAIFKTARAAYANALKGELTKH